MLEKILFEEVATMSEIEQQDSFEKISFFEKIAYGGGDLASCLIQCLTATYLTFFYTDALGMNAAIIGAIMMFSRFFDGISDIVMGYIVDRTRTKYGKARPWLLWLAVPMSIATVMIFLVPNIGEAGKYIYVIITYNLVSTFLYTMINIPYGTLTSLMTRDQNQRLSINVIRSFMAQVGTLIISASLLPLVNFVGGSTHQRSWIIVSIAFSVIAAILYLLCFFKTKERVVISSGTKKEENLKFGTAIKIIFKNSQWIIVSCVWLAFALASATSIIMAAYYAKYILMNENLTGIISAVGIIPMLVCMPFMAFLGKKLGKRNLALVGSLVFLVGQFLMILNPESAGWIMFCSAIIGVGKSAFNATMFAMVADTIEYGEWKTGVRVEGTLYSSSTFGAKIGSGIAGAVVMFKLGSSGYNGLAAVQPASALNTIKTIFLWGPVPFIAIMLILFVIYKLDKIYPQVMSDLKKREAEKNN